MKPAATLAKESAKAKRGSLELAMHQQLRALGLDRGMVREFPVAADRKWRFDFAWPDDRRVALEVEGGTWTGGRHVTGAGFEADCEKYSAAAIAGWRVLRVTSSQIRSGAAAQWIARALGEIGQ